MILSPFSETITADGSNNLDSANPTGAGGAPLAPTGFTSVYLSDTSLSLAWTDNATNELNYELDRSLTGTGSWTALADPAANATTATSTGLTVDKQYFYRLRAVNAAGNSSYATANGTTTANSKGLLWPTGIEPTGSTLLDVQGGNRIWYVDAAVADGGVGTVGDPLNNFTALLGWFDGANFQAGTLGFAAGDHVWIKGVFDFVNHANGTKNYDMQFRRANQLGTIANPTVIRAWRGFTAEFKSDKTVHRIIQTVVTNLAGGEGLAIVNLEMYDNLGVPIWNDDNLEAIQIISCNLHDMYTDGAASGDANRGGMSVNVRLAGVTRVIRNNKIYNTDLLLAGGRSSFADNNISAIRLQGTNVAIGGGTADIYDNDISGSSHGIGEKHTGTATITIYDNDINDCLGFGYYNRQTGVSTFRNNVVVTGLGVVEIVRETEYDARNLSVYKNTGIDVERLIGLSHSEINVSVLTIRDNLTSQPAQTAVSLWLGYTSQGGFTLTSTTSLNNMYDTNNATTFLFRNNVSRTFTQAMSDLSDTTSTMANPLFVNRAGGNYNLDTGSPAIGTASDGGNIGAF